MNVGFRQNHVVPVVFSSVIARSIVRIVGFQKKTTLFWLPMLSTHQSVIPSLPSFAKDVHFGFFCLLTSFPRIDIEKGLW